MTGIALAWRDDRVRLGGLEADSSLVVCPSFTFLTDVQRVQTPAKKETGRLSSRANQAGGRDPSGRSLFSAKLVDGTTQQLSTPSHRHYWGDATLRILVTPESGAGARCVVRLVWGENYIKISGTARATSVFARVKRDPPQGRLRGSVALMARPWSQRQRRYSRPASALRGRIGTEALGALLRVPRGDFFRRHAGY